MADDWFRNKEWDSRIEIAFFDKLRRARRKEQYLRIQAYTIASTQPEVALRLLDEYFKLDDDFDHAQAHVDRATAYLALENLEAAVQALEAALAREEVFPNRQTDAKLILPFLIATRGMEALYERALQVLARYHSRLTFPIDYFRWFAAKALILHACGKPRDATVNACEAIGWAKKVHSGFRYHPTVGLVGSEYEGTASKLKELCGT